MVPVSTSHSPSQDGGYYQERSTLTSSESTRRPPNAAALGVEPSYCSSLHGEEDLVQPMGKSEKPNSVPLSSTKQKRVSFLSVYQVCMYNT